MLFRLDISAIMEAEMMTVPEIMVAVLDLGLYGSGRAWPVQPSKTATPDTPISRLIGRCVPCGVSEIRLQGQSSALVKERKRGAKEKRPARVTNRSDHQSDICDYFFPKKANK